VKAKGYIMDYRSR